jgi:Fur family transcriptional regulator, ferric uptake regulator
MIIISSISMLRGSAPMLNNSAKSIGTVLPIPNNNETSYFDESWTEDDLKQIIRKMNLKVTPQRLLILQTLHEGRVHITAQELYEKVQKINSDVGFATVYRFLKGMAESHVVTELRMGSMPTRYELTPKKHHDHMTCTQCGKIVEFQNKNIEDHQEKVAKQYGFKLTHHVLELYGICTACQMKK